MLKSGSAAIMAAFGGPIAALASRTAAAAQCVPAAASTRVAGPLIDVSGLAAGDSFTLQMSTVPEPGRLALLLLGLAGAGAAARRRR